MGRKISGKRNRLKWLLKGVLYFLMFLWKILMAALYVSIFLLWITVFLLILVISFVLWLSLSPLELILFIFTGWTHFLIWPKIVTLWWVSIDTWFGNDWIDKTCSKMFCLIEDEIIKTL